jgi:[ribosomal protein S5]-alanine N-acetyltransferase
VHLRTSITECRLRPWASADGADLVAFANNRRVWRNLTDAFPHPYTKADADGWIITANAKGRSIHLAIAWNEQAIGGIGAIAGDGMKIATADFGYWLGEPFWGKGIATAAAIALADWLMAERVFSRLQATVYEWNPASGRVLEKAGFIKEGVLRKSITKDGHLIDTVMYARTAA